LKRLLYSITVSMTSISKIILFTEITFRKYGPFPDPPEGRWAIVQGEDRGMEILVPVKRVIDCNVKVRVKRTDRASISQSRRCR
jgi:hypothetical protein